MESERKNSGLVCKWHLRGTTWALRRECGREKVGKRKEPLDTIHTIINLLSERHKRRDGQQSGLPSNVAVPDSVSSPAARFLFTFLKTTPDFHQIKMIKSSQLFLRPNLNLVIYYRGWVWVVCFKEPQTTVFAPVDEAEKHKTPKICINYPK